MQNHQVNILIPDELPIVRVDGRAVTEVIYTLLDNARKYAPPQTQITISACLATNEVIEIAIEDQGPGIPIQYRDRVFERFFRIAANGFAQGHIAGFGVGLAIAKGIVEAHGGRIWIEDAKTGNGARIVFTVPVADTDENVPSPSGRALE
jgi:two-component system sensor histidine kinase KdpD